MKHTATNPIMLTLHGTATIEHLGLIPHMVSSRAGSFKQSILNNYEFYTGPMTGGTVAPDGRYQYPGDPDLYPLAKYESNDEAMYQYAYDIIAVIDKATNQTTWVARIS